MVDYISIGPAPASERCVQVGETDYHERSRRECRAFIGQLRRALGPEPEGASFAVKTHRHDFGSYREVVCYFDGSKAAAVDYAFRAEAEAPTEWDELARAELGLGTDGAALRALREQLAEAEIALQAAEDEYARVKAREERRLLIELERSTVGKLTDELRRLWIAADLTDSKRHAAALAALREAQANVVRLRAKLDRERERRRAAELEAQRRLLDPARAAGRQPSRNGVGLHR